jgi:hypothetical protein
MCAFTSLATAAWLGRRSGFDPNLSCSSSCPRRRASSADQGVRGEIVQDTSKPDGTPRKLMDVSRLSALGWKARIGLREGIAGTYRWFLENAQSARV